MKNLQLILPRGTITRDVLNSNPSTLDLSFRFVQIEVRLVKCFAYPTHSFLDKGSDHMPVEAEIQITWEENPPLKKTWTATNGKLFAETYSLHPQYNSANQASNGHLYKIYYWSPHHCDHQIHSGGYDFLLTQDLSSTKIANLQWAPSYRLGGRLSTNGKEGDTFRKRRWKDTGQQEIKLNNWCDKTYATTAGKKLQKQQET